MPPAETPVDLNHVPTGGGGPVALVVHTRGIARTVELPQHPARLLQALQCIVGGDAQLFNGPACASGRWVACVSAGLIDGLEPSRHAARVTGWDAFAASIPGGPIVFLGFSADLPGCLTDVPAPVLDHARATGMLEAA